MAFRLVTRLRGAQKQHNLKWGMRLNSSECDLKFEIMLFLCPAQAGHWAERPSVAEFIPRLQQMKTPKLTHIGGLPE